MNGFVIDGVNGEDGDLVIWYGIGKDNDYVFYGGVVEDFVGVFCVVG